MLEDPTAGQTWSEAGSEICQNNLWEEHYPIARGAKTETVGAGKDRTGGRKCNVRQPLNEPDHVDQTDFGSAWHRQNLLNTPRIFTSRAIEETAEPRPK